MNHSGQTTRLDGDRSLSEERDALSRARLDLGFNAASLVLMTFLLVLFLLNLDQYASLSLGVSAWLLIGATLVAALLLRFRLPDELPGWLFIGALVIWAAAVTLDIVATASPSCVPLTAAAAVGPALVICAQARPARDIVLATVALGLALTLVLVLRTCDDTQLLGPAAVTIAVAVGPPLISVQIVRSLHTLVQLELDLVQAQSAVSSPGYAVGMMASEELARLDLATERLLDGVATGRTALPLDASTAEAAANLATELRLHLVHGRTETWLYHAVTESALLGPAVALSDPDGLAARLSRDQRDGLLTAVWLLISDPVRAGIGQPRGLKLVLTCSSAPTAGSPGAATTITIMTTGVPRNGVDAAAWQAIRKVGRFVESFSDSTLRIDITAVSDVADDLS